MVHDENRKQNSGRWRYQSSFLPMQLISQNNAFEVELLVLGALLLLLWLFPALLGGALALALFVFCVVSVCWPIDWFRKAIFEALIRAAGPSNDGHGEMHGVEQWLLLRSHWSSRRINSSALGPPLLCAPEMKNFYKSGRNFKR